MRSRCGISCRNMPFDHTKDTKWLLSSKPSILLHLFIHTKNDRSGRVNEKQKQQRVKISNPAGFHTSAHLLNHCVKWDCWLMENYISCWAQHPWWQYQRSVWGGGFRRCESIQQELCLNQYRLIVDYFCWQVQVCFFILNAERWPAEPLVFFRPWKAFRDASVQYFTI